MGLLPLEDTFTDVISKAQRGLRITDDELCTRAGVTQEDLDAIKSGTLLDAVIRRVARHLGLGPNALEDLAHDRWYPEQTRFPHGFAMFHTRFEGMGVNSYLAWDGHTRQAAAFDTGADSGGMLEIAQSERLRVEHIFLTHAHDDHIADLDRLARETGATVWIGEREPFERQDLRRFRDSAHFHLGNLAIKTLSTWGHSPGQTTYAISGLSHPLAIVGDSIFAGSMGGSATHFEDQRRNNLERILSLSRGTVIAPGHGPLSTVGQEKKHNPFFAS